MFLNTVVYKGTRFNEKVILDVKTHFKQTETFQHTHFRPLSLTDLSAEKPLALRKVWGKYFKFQKKKNAWRTEATNTIFEIKIAIRNK